jgi:hypothetical protein
VQASAALGAFREVYRYLQPSESGLVDAELMRVLELVEVGGRVSYEGLADFGR